LRLLGVGLGEGIHHADGILELALLEHFEGLFDFVEVARAAPFEFFAASTGAICVRIEGHNVCGVFGENSEYVGADRAFPLRFLPISLTYRTRYSVKTVAEV